MIVEASVGSDGVETAGQRDPDALYLLWFPGGRGAFHRVAALLRAGGKFHQGACGHCEEGVSFVPTAYWGREKRVVRLFKTVPNFVTAKSGFRSLITKDGCVAICRSIAIGMGVRIR